MSDSALEKSDDTGKEIAYIVTGKSRSIFKIACDSLGNTLWGINAKALFRLNDSALIGDSTTIKLDSLENYICIAMTKDQKIVLMTNHRIIKYSPSPVTLRTNPQPGSREINVRMDRTSLRIPLVENGEQVNLQVFDLKGACIADLHKLIMSDRDRVISLSGLRLSAMPYLLRVKTNTNVFSKVIYCR